MLTVFGAGGGVKQLYQRRFGGLCGGFRSGLTDEDGVVDLVVVGSCDGASMVTRASAWLQAAWELRVAGQSSPLGKLGRDRARGWPS